MFTLSRLIDDIMLLRNKKKEEARKDVNFHLWVSDLGGCPRKLKLRQLNYPKLPFTLDSLNNFERGNTLHLWITDLLKSVDAKELYPDMAILEEEWLEKEKGIVGRIDLLITTGGKKYLFEIKSMDKNNIKYIQDKDIYESRPKDVLQIVAYNDKIAGIDELRLFYISEDLSWKLEYLIEPEKYQEVYKTELAKCQGIMDNNQEIPPAEFCFMCYSKRYGKIYCNYIESCCEGLGIEFTDGTKTKVKEVSNGKAK